MKSHLDISNAKDVATFRRCLVDFASDFGFGLASVSLFLDPSGGGPKCHSISNVPSAFAEAYIDPANGRRDPVLRLLKRVHVPFMYDQRFYVENDAADLWEEQAPFGYRQGIATCMHLPHGRHFALGVDRPEPLPTNADARAEIMAAVHLLAAHAFDAAVRVLGIEIGAVSVPTLTTREREALQWTAAGKSAWVAGEIMSISERAVNFHLRSACAKLGSYSKHQAAFKALQLGLL